MDFAPGVVHLFSSNIWILVVFICSLICNFGGSKFLRKLRNYLKLQFLEAPSPGKVLQIKYMCLKWFEANCSWHFQVNRKNWVSPLFAILSFLFILFSAEPLPFQVSRSETTNCLIVLNVIQCHDWETNQQILSLVCARSLIRSQLLLLKSRRKGLIT